MKGAVAAGAFVAGLVGQAIFAATAAATPPLFTRVAEVCTRLKRENCEELDRYCVFSDCLVVRNDNNKYRACARACGEALANCEAACDDR